MTKLWEVTVQYTLYVLSDTERGAEHCAEDNADEEEPESVTATEITDPSRLSAAVRNSLPWCNNVEDEEMDKTIGELLWDRAVKEKERKP